MGESVWRVLWWLSEESYLIGVWTVWCETKCEAKECDVSISWRKLQGHTQHEENKYTSYKYGKQTLKQTFSVEKIMRLHFFHDLWLQSPIVEEFMWKRMKNPLFCRVTDNHFGANPLTEENWSNYRCLLFWVSRSQAIFWVDEVMLTRERVLLFLFRRLPFCMKFISNKTLL